MNTIIERFDGVELVRPVGDFRWPHPTFDGFPTCCGAGDWGDRIVPDNLWGLNISPACWIHDQMFTMAPANWSAFHHANSVFLHNLNAINESKSGNIFIKKMRQIRAIEYYTAVDTLGAVAFWNCKKGK